MKPSPTPLRIDARRADPPPFSFPLLRPPALQDLARASDRPAKCVAIVAPVGYGKTVLMSMLLNDLRRIGKQCLWLALDDRDAGLDRIINELETRLHGGEPAPHPTQALFGGRESPEERADALLDRINRHPTPITIFIDNLNCCTDAALPRLLDGMLFRTRPAVHLVLSSTRELPLDAARAQLEGLITRLGPTELGFGAAETADLLGIALCKRIGPQGIEDLVRRTEGWPAALRMAQIILANAAEPRAALQTFSGSDQALADLLNDQVIRGFTPQMQNFLFCVAQLRTFSAELCGVAIDARNARKNLAEIIERNLFVIPLDRNRSWYRLHGLFRDHLLKESSTALPPRRRQSILIRAARWCEKKRLWSEAIDYALASGSAATATEILERAAPSFVRDRGDVPQYIAWMETLHERGQLAGPEAEYWFIWALAFHRRYDDARRLSARLTARVRRRKGDLRRRVAILRASIDSFADRLEEAYRGASKWLSGSSARKDDPFNLTAAHCIESWYFSNELRFIDARRAIQAARESAFQANSAYVNGWVTSFSAMIAVYEGNYAAAYEELVNALTTTRAALGDETGIFGTMALLAARCATGMGRNDDARQLLESGLSSSRTHGFLDAVTCALEAAVLLWDGSPGEQATLTKLEEIASAYPSRSSFMLSCFLVRRLIRLGRLDDARARALRIELRLEPSRRRPSKHSPRGAWVESLAAAVKIEWLLANRRDAQASGMIAQELRRAKSRHHHVRQVELELNSAVIAARRGEIPIGVRYITRAVYMAAARRIVQPFLDHGPALASIIDKAKPAAWGFATAEERRFFAEICRRLAQSAPAAQTRLALVQEQPQLRGQLTKREAELLRFVDTGLTNQQLADRLDVSLATVKWHLQNLYGKLGVANRSSALAHARRLNLLAH